MRIAYFSPLPPSKSGIADYSAALLASLRQYASVDTFTANPAEAPEADISLYQIGNNDYHSFVYERAIAHPGVVVLHEANLHHLIAEMTIKRKDWDAYLREVEYEGGAVALRYAQRVRALEVGPDYEGVPMLRRLLESARGVIVHSRFVEAGVLHAGYRGPVAVIPHGAWIPEANPHEYRSKLGVQPFDPLIGIFGFLKPYKRITESLRAMRRLVREQPAAKMILVGEPHPDYPLQSLIAGMGLQSNVRVLGFTPIEEFTGYIAACDIVLNLRWPTVGESSGTLLRAFGLGKAVIVSDVGSFSEYPDEICLKVPVDATEEDTLFEYLNALVARPEAAQALGSEARHWVARECNWDLVAQKYVSFLGSVIDGRECAPPAKPEEPVVTERHPHVPVEYIQGWAENEGAVSYLQTHGHRLAKTLDITPPGGPGASVLEMGAYVQITPALQSKLGYHCIRGCYYGKLGEVNHKSVTSADGEHFEIDIDLFDAERDRFPYEDESFDTVLCCELLEHLPSDPMHMMGEINRILKPAGALVMTTPNIASHRAIAAILMGYHPGFFPAYIKPAAEGQEPDARHNREYAPRELRLLLEESGFEVTLLETGEFREDARPEHAWISHMLATYRLPMELRGDGLYAVGRKRGPVRQRYPHWLYN